MRVVAIVAICLSAACSGDNARESAPADTLSRAQRDSVIGASSLPGARGVQRAIEARDTANARNAAMDSLLRD